MEILANINGTTPPGTTTATHGIDPGPSRNTRVRATRIPGASKVMRRIGRNLRVASWNVGSMTGRSFELEEMMRRRRVDILCVQETKWRNTGNRARFLDVKTKAYKMFYYGTDQVKNGIGIILAEELLGSVMTISKSSDRLMSLKLVMQGKVWNIVSAYAPQIGCEQVEKDAFWLDFHNLLKDIPKEEFLFVGGDLNGHVGKTNEDYDDCHGGMGYGTRNTPGEDILCMCKSHGLIVLNTMFIKQDRHLVTYSSGGNETQIDYHLVSKFMKSRVKDCKVILGEAVAQQHRLLLTEFFTESVKKIKQTRTTGRIKWYNLDKDKGEKFISNMRSYLCNTISAEQNAVSTSTAQSMWDCLQQTCLVRAKSLLGVSKGHYQQTKETWWWNDEAKAVINKKKTAFKAWSKCPLNNRDEKTRLEVEYRSCKKEAKKKCAQLQAKSTEDMYRELEKMSAPAANANQALQEIRQNNLNKGATIFKIAAQRRRNAQEIRSPKFINDAQGHLLVDDDKILHRWRQYCDGLLNEKFPRRHFPTAAPNFTEVSDITVEEVSDAVKNSKKGKAIGPDEIPYEFWKKMGDVGIKWLSIFISKLIGGDRLPNQWRESYLLPMYKGKGDTRICDNYRSIKLMSHTLKIIERVLDSRLRKIIRLSDDQCGFVAGKSTTDAIQSIRILMEKHRDSLENLHVVLVDFEKAFDRQPRDLIWVALRHRGVPETYVRMIEDMYEGAVTRVRCPAGVTEEFQVTVGVHQGSVLSPLLFITVLDYLLDGKIPDTVHQLFFADDGAIISEDPTSLQRALDIWVDVLEGSGYRISPKKTEYLCCPFSDPDMPIPDIYLNGNVLPKCEKFKYLGSMINSEATCDDDINHRISVGWMKWRENSAIFCDRKMPPKLKGRLYTAVVRPALTYGSQCWTMYKKYESKLTAAEMKMLRMTAGVTKLDRIRSTKIRGSLHVKNTVLQKIEHDRLSWYCHVQRRDPENPVKKAISYNVPTVSRRTKKKGRPKHSWYKQMQRHQHLVDLRHETIQNREACRRFLRSTRRTPRADH